MNEPHNFPYRFTLGNLWRRYGRRVVTAALGASAVAMVLFALMALFLTASLPPVTALSDTPLNVPLRVYTADGQLIAEFGEEKRIPVRIEDVPDPLIKAVVAAEDQHFYTHYGVDLPAILRAVWNNLRARGARQGGSTITMQVARNYFLGPEKTYIRKLKEALLALKIERTLSKPEILELYFNKIFLGQRAYGFAAAAQIYYGKALQDLTLPEMAVLAGLPKAPSRDNPLANPKNAMERRDYVLRNMYRLGFIDAQTLAAALAAPQTASPHSFIYGVEAPYVAEMVRQYMLSAYDARTYAGGFNVYTTINARDQRAANRALRAGILAYERRHGYRGPAGHIAWHEPPEMDRLADALKDFRVVGGLVPGVVVNLGETSAQIYTHDGATVDLGWDGLSWARPYIDRNTVGPPPHKASDVLKPGDIVYLEAVEPAGAEQQASGWRLAQLPAVAGALVSLRPSDGAVLALAGGFDSYQSGYNRATQAERQPGSSFKPFVYAAALDKGFTPATTVSGAPIVMESDTPEDEWRPEDYSKKFFGPTRLREALAQSRNLVSVRLLRTIGVPYALGYLPRFGFDAAKLPRNLSLVLGTTSATPMQMAIAFAVFANGGYRVAPYFIARIEDAEHKVLEQVKPLVACRDCETAGATGAAEAPRAVTAADTKAGAAAARPDNGGVAPRVLSPAVDFLMTSMMQEVIRSGTGQAALALGRNDLAGKTGTTNEYRDAWFSGFNADVVTTVWVGFDQPASLGRAETGGRAALPIWIDYMRAALSGIPETPPAPPDDVVPVLVNSDTGRPTSAGDPQAMQEYFVKGADTGGPEATAGNGQTPPSAPPADVPDNIRENLF